MPKHIENTPETSQPFEKFEGLAKKLMAVPKKELDAELAKYERKKTGRRRALKPKRKG